MYQIIILFYTRAYGESGQTLIELKRTTTDAPYMHDGMIIKGIVLG